LSPDEVVATSILDLRARRLAERVKAPEHRASLGTLVVVKVGAERLGIPVLGLREIVRIPPITPLPRSAEGIEGLVQLRGEVMTVADLGAWLGIAPRSGHSHLAVLDGPSGPLGFLVGAVLGFRPLFGDELQSARLATGVAVTGRTPDLVLVLDLERLFAAPPRLGDISTGTPPSTGSGE
jgi:chemotaxis signal transduction protein